MLGNVQRERVNKIQKPWNLSGQTQIPSTKSNKEKIVNKAKKSGVFSSYHNSYRTEEEEEEGREASTFPPESCILSMH